MISASDRLPRRGWWHRGHSRISTTCSSPLSSPRSSGRNSSSFELGCSSLEMVGTAVPCGSVLDGKTVLDSKASSSLLLDGSSLSWLPTDDGVSPGLPGRGGMTEFLFCRIRKVSSRQITDWSKVKSAVSLGPFSAPNRWKKLSMVDSFKVDPSVSSIVVISTLSMRPLSSASYCLSMSLQNCCRSAL